MLGLTVTLLAPLLSVFLLPIQISAEQLGANERNAGITLRTLASAQYDFYTNDRDGNGIRDYWTGDIAMLARLGLIERAVGEADAKPLNPLVSKPIPMYGYYFVALDSDESEKVPEVLRQITDAKSGKVHHLEKWAFCAYPAEPDVTGRFIYLIHSGYGSPLSVPVKGRRIPRSVPPDSDMIHWYRCSGGG